MPARWRCTIYIYVYIVYIMFIQYLKIKLSEVDIIKGLCKLPEILWQLMPHQLWQQVRRGHVVP